MSTTRREFLVASAAGALALAATDLRRPAEAQTVAAPGPDPIAIELANDTIYGLNNAVFSNDIEKVYAAARRLRSGNVGHNGSRSDFRLGFGGFKQSGIGREGGLEGIKALTEVKIIVLDEEPAALR